jgi:hypothetical protein
MLMCCELSQQATTLSKKGSEKTSQRAATRLQKNVTDLTQEILLDFAWIPDNIGKNTNIVLLYNKE